MPDDYWTECIAEAADECGAKLTDTQINEIAGWVEGAHENFGMAYGHDAIPNPLEEDLANLKQKLKEERDKVVCLDCGGGGMISVDGPYHSATSQCGVCRGEGRVLPYASKAR